MKELRENTDPLAALRTIINWYKEAGIEVLSEERNIDRIAQILALRQERATDLSLSKAKPITQVKQVKTDIANKNRENTPVSLNIKDRGLDHKGRGITDQLSSESAKKAIEFVKNIHSVDELHLGLKELDILSIQKTAAYTFLGDGYDKADLVVINAAPSAQDDRSGLLMSAKDGALFDKMISSINMMRENIYITNMVFWRPPGDRSPTQTEIATCLPILEKLIELIQPQYIITMGTIVSQIFTGQNAPISKLRGKFYPYKSLLDNKHDISAQVRPLYSPQYLISSPALKQDAWYDLLAIKNALSQVRVL